MFYIVFMQAYISIVFLVHHILDYISRLVSISCNNVKI